MDPDVKGILDFLALEGKMPENPWNTGLPCPWRAKYTRMENWASLP